MPVTPATMPEVSVRRVVGMIVAIVVAAMLSRLLSPGQSFSLVWAPAGLVFAFAWKYGRWTLAPSALALAGWGLLAYPALPWVGAAAAAAEIACTLPALAILRAALSRRDSESDRAIFRGMPNLRWLLRFYVAALIVGATLAASVGTAGFAASGLHSGVGYVQLWGAYWITQALGVLLFAPLTLAWLGAGPHDAHAVPFPSRAERGGLRMSSRHEGLDTASVVVVLALSALVLLLRATGHGEFVAAATLAYIPATAFCAMLRDAVSTYATLVFSALVLCTALLFDVSALSRSISDIANTRVPLAFFETVTVVFVSTLLAQLLQAVSRDRTEAMSRLREQANRDIVTGLANELGVEQWLRRSDSTRSFLLVGVAILGRGRIGVLVGPEQLVEMRQRIADRIRLFGELLAARLQTGRYVVAFTDTPKSLQRVAAMRHPFEALTVRNSEGREAFVPAAIQILRVPPGPRPTAAALLSVLVSLQQRDQHEQIGRKVDADELVVHEFSSTLRAETERDARRKDHIQNLIVANQIELFAQIIRPACAKTVVTDIDLEILCRLCDQGGEILQPDAFIHVANQAGMSAELDRQIILAVFDWYQNHPDALARTRKCAINLSAASLTDSAFLPFMRGALDERALASNPFCFEITESSAVDDVERSRDIVQRLRADGFRVSIDDFGTGFATYSYLKRYEVDEIKIDGAFVSALGESKIDNEIVESIVRVARRLNVKTVAEFVATDELRSHVERLGVDYVQGYAIGKPVPIAQIYDTPVIKQDS